MSAHETISLAHTARCKLQMAANRPDRDFRFILGHALTLDKLMLRVAEIEIDSSDSGEDESGLANEEPAGPRQRRVSFSASSRTRQDLASAGERSGGRAQRSPPPPSKPGPEDDEDEDDIAVEDDEDDEQLGLQRFPSASGRPPRNAEDEGYNSPSEEELRSAIEGKGSDELKEAYEHIQGCPCHGKDAPAATNIWEVPSKGGGGRMAVVQVQEVMA